MTTVDIVVTFTDGSTSVTLPVVPAKIVCGYGNASPVTVNILALGEVNFNNGVSLDTYTFSSFFPRRYDSGYCNTKNLKKPEKYVEQFNRWKKEGTEIRVVIPAIKINQKVKVISFTGEYRGAEADFYYSLQVQQHKTIKCIKVASKSVKVEEPRTPKPASLDLNVGDIVTFTGGGVFLASNRSSPTYSQNKNTKCKITQKYSGKHPVHLIQLSGQPSCYGWVDTSNVKT